MARVCNCGSKELKTLTAIQGQFKTNTSSKTLGGGIFGGGGGGMKMGAGVASTSGESSAELLKKVQYYVPKYPPSMITILVFVFAALFGALLWGNPGPADSTNPQIGLVMFIVGLFFAVTKYRRRRKYPSEYDEFKRTWYCFSCGSFMTFKK